MSDLSPLTETGSVGFPHPGSVDKTQLFRRNVSLSQTVEAAVSCFQKVPTVLGSECDVKGSGPAFHWELCQVGVFCVS